jgi:hypothetical protein
MSAAPRVSGEVVRGVLDITRRAVDATTTYSAEVAGLMRALEAQIIKENKSDCYKEVLNDMGQSFFNRCKHLPSGPNNHLITENTWFYKTGENHSGGEVGFTKELGAGPILYVSQPGPLMPFAIVRMPCENIKEDRRNGRTFIKLI